MKFSDQDIDPAGMVDFRSEAPTLVTLSGTKPGNGTTPLHRLGKCLMGATAQERAVAAYLISRPDIIDSFEDQATADAVRKLTPGEREVCYRFLTEPDTPDRIRVQNDPPRMSGIFTVIGLAITGVVTLASTIIGAVSGKRTQERAYEEAELARQANIQIVKDSLESQEQLAAMESRQKMIQMLLVGTSLVALGWIMFRAPK